MNDTKVNLNIILPGRVLMSSQECEKNPKLLEKQVIRVESLKKDKKKRKFIKNIEYLNIYVRKCKTASQSVNLTKQAYDYMTSKECPSFVIPKDWSRMSKVKKLEAHLEELCKALGGISYTYQIFED